MTHLKKNCRCCRGSYATGKDYGWYHSVLPISNTPFEGLCEFCNPNDKTWYTPKMKCHLIKAKLRPDLPGPLLG